MYHIYLPTYYGISRIPVASSNLHNGKRALKKAQSKESKGGGQYAISNSAQRNVTKGKAIAINSAEIKIVRTEAQNSLRPIRLSAFMTKLFFNV